MQALQTIYRYWAAVLLLGVIAQIAAAGYGAFYSAERLDVEGNQHKTINDDTFSAGFDFHSGFGYLVVLGAILLFLLALGARLGRRRVWWNLALPLVGILQVILAWAGTDSPFVGALHATNALVLLGLTGFLAREAWWGTRMPTSTVTPAA
ncbi:MAG: DUF6220 domain-containing protein [Gaiellaceae bacterium]